MRPQYIAHRAFMPGPPLLRAEAFAVELRGNGAQAQPLLLQETHALVCRVDVGRGARRRRRRTGPPWLTCRTLVDTRCQALNTLFEVREAGLEMADVGQHVGQQGCVV